MAELIVYSILDGTVGNAAGLYRNDKLTWADARGNGASLGVEQVDDYFDVGDLWSDAMDYRCRRGFATFDTSALPVGAVISNAMFRVRSVCFIGETLVTTQLGQKEIQEVQVGDQVLSYDFINRCSRLSTVTYNFISVSDDVSRYFFEDGYSVSCTPNHMFLCDGLGWKPIGELQPGMKVVTRTGIAEFSGKTRLANRVNTVFNIEVEPNHNYYVGSSNLLAHNKSPIIHIVEGVQGNPVIPADFGSHVDMNTSYGSHDFGVSTIANISLSAAGIAKIVPGGLTKYCLRSVGDIDNIVPVDVNVEYLWAITDDRPRLTITYLLPVSFVPSGNRSRLLYFC